MLFCNSWNQESAGRVYFNISREKPAHTPDTPHVQPLSCKLEWTNQKHFYCFLLKPIRDNLAPGFPRALDLSPLHAQKSSGLRLGVTAKVISKQAHYFIFGLYGTFGLHNGGRRSDLLKVWKRRFLRLRVAAEFFDDDFHHTLPTSFQVSSPIRCISFWH